MRKVAVIVGSIRKNSINKTLARALAKLADGKLVFDTVQDRRPAALQPGRRDEPDADGHPHEGADQGGGRDSLRDAGAQPLDPGRAEERHRLGVAASKGQRRSTARSERSSARRAGGFRRQSRRAICKTIVGSHLDAVLGVPEAYIQFTDTLIDADANVTDEAAKKVMTRFID